MNTRFTISVASACLASWLLPGTSQAAAPVITTQPQPAIVTTGQQAQVAVLYNASCGTVLPQWQFGGVNIQDGPVYSGTTTGVLTINATATVRGSYRVVLTCADGSGTAVSNSANLAVKATSTVVTLPPMINNLGWSGCSGNACSIWWTGTNGAINASKLTLAPMGGTPVDVTGLTSTTVYPTTSTIYTLTASNSAGTYAQNVFVPVGGYTATISSCGAITAPGRYLITSSISSNSTTTACIDVKNTNNVFIDCASGVTVSGLGAAVPTPTRPPGSGAINFTNVHGFAVRSCKATMSAQSGGQYFVTFGNSSMGYVFNSTFGNPTLNGRQGLVADQSNYVTFNYDTIYNEVALNTNAAGFAFQTSAIKNTNMLRPVTAANISQWLGASSLQVINSTLDGGATAPGVGADDGIVGDSGGNDLYAFSTIKNYWDAGIEITEQQYGDTIHQVWFQNAGYGSINLNRDGSVSDTIVSWNHIDMTNNFQPVGGFGYPIYIGSAPSGPLYFQNNNFNNNFILNGPYSSSSQFMTFQPSSWVVGGNVFYSNYFNYNNYPGIPAPAFTTPYLPNLVTDWGGNVCAHPNPPGYPLVCH